MNKNSLLLLLVVLSLEQLLLTLAWTLPSVPITRSATSRKGSMQRWVSTGDVTPTTPSKIPYNWKDQWYVLTYASYVPNPSKSAEATPASVFGHPLVLWRQEDDGPIYCASDRCPHRATALSEGRVRDGKLECLYHGWQFTGKDNNDGGGACTRIPQLEPGALIPKRACLDVKPCRVDEGMVWVWMGDGPPTRDPPRTNVLGPDGKAKGWNVYDFMIDLPYDHSYLVENLLDPAHIDISHDRTPGGGKRENAQAYEMHVDEDSMDAQGFTGHFRFAAQPERPYTNFTFEAPGIVRNKFAGKLGNGMEFRFEAGLHCMPVALGRSRLFFRVYNQGLPWLATFILNLKPTWLRHLNSCKVLEQDVGLITTQEDHFARQNPGRQPQDDYLLIKSSDTYVGAYRKWMDRVGHGMPWFQGLVSSGGQPYGHIAVPPATISPGQTPAQHRASNQDIVETRYHRHVMHSPVTRNALRNIVRLKRVCMGLAGGALTAALVPVFLLDRPSTQLVRRVVRAAAWVLPLSGLAVTALYFLEREFHVSFKRKDQLRGESGLVP